MPDEISKVTSKINNLQTQRSGDNKPVKIVSQNADANKKSAEASPLKSDSVSLTDGAARLKTLEDQIARAPIVDTQKVEQIQKAINDGSYQIDPEKIARKLVEFESALS